MTSQTSMKTLATIPIPEEDCEALRLAHQRLSEAQTLYDYVSKKVALSTLASPLARELGLTSDGTYKVRIDAERLYCTVQVEVQEETK